MTIEESKRNLRYAINWKDRPTDESMTLAIDIMRKYQQLQADYETRLKADTIAMLEELKEQLREMHEDFFETEHFEEAYGVYNSMDVIQEKINDLVGEDGNNRIEEIMEDGKMDRN